MYRKTAFFAFFCTQAAAQAELGQSQAVIDGFGPA